MCIVYVSLRMPRLFLEVCTRNTMMAAIRMAVGLGWKEQLVYFIYLLRSMYYNPVHGFPIQKLVLNI